MQINSLPSERVAVVGAIDPDAYTAASPSTTYKSDWVNMARFHSLLAIVQTGILGTAANLDAKLVQATDSSGTGEKDISGKAITQLDEAGASPPDTNDKQYLINLRTDELDVDNGFDHVQLHLTLQDATSDLSAILLGFDPRYGPADDNDLASVAQIIT